MKHRRWAALGVSGILLVTCVLVFAAASAKAPGSEQLTESPEWVQIFDQQAVMIGQITPADSDSDVSDWQTGALIVDYQRLSQDLSQLGRSGGFIQVVEFETYPHEGIWEVRNFPVLDLNVLPSSSVAFIFDPVNGPISSRTVAVFHTQNPAQRPSPQATHLPPNGQAIPQVNQVIPVHFNPRGAVIPPPPQLIPQINPIFPGVNAPGVPPLTPADSVEQEVNQCGPAAVANSFEYLRRFLGVQDGLTNSPSTANGSGTGAIDPNSRVAALDQTMNRQRVPVQLGTPTLNIIEGKLQYISNRNLGQTLVVKHQGRFCPGANPNDPNCRVGNITRAGVTSTAVGDAQGAVVTENFIRREIRDKEDVELCFISLRVAHCVHVTGYSFTNGFLRLHIVQDAQQGRAGGVAEGTLGHMVLTVGIAPNGTLWITDFPGGPALVTNVITESPKKK
jgi:hypothetical protein